MNRIIEHYPVFELRVKNCENLARYVVDAICVCAVPVPPAALSRWLSLGNLPLQRFVPPSSSYDHDASSPPGPYVAAEVGSAGKLSLVCILLILLEVLDSKQPFGIGSETEYHEDAMMKMFQEPEMAMSSLPRRSEIWVLPYNLGRLAFNGARAVILLFQYFTDNYIEDAWSQAIEIFSRLLRLNEPAPNLHPRDERRDAVPSWKGKITTYLSDNWFILHLAVAYVERGDLDVEIASKYRRQRHLKNACELYKAALLKKERILGDEHPDTLKTIECLAETHNDLGETSKARDLHEKVLVTRKRIFGEEHADTLKSMNSLAETNVRLGEMTRALSIWEATLETSKNIFGLEHPNMLRNMHNFAETHRSLGNVNMALVIHENILVIRARIYGEEHPDALKSMNNLADMYESLGNTGKTLELRKKVKVANERKFDPEQSNALQRINSSAATYPDLEEARNDLAVHNKFLTPRKSTLGCERSDPQQNSSSISLARSGIRVDGNSTSEELQTDGQRTANDACKSNDDEESTRDQTKLRYSEPKALTDVLGVTSGKNVEAELKCSEQVNTPPTEQRLHEEFADCHSLTSDPMDVVAGWLELVRRHPRVRILHSKLAEAYDLMQDDNAAIAGWLMLWEHNPMNVSLLRNLRDACNRKIRKESCQQDLSLFYIAWLGFYSLLSHWLVQWDIYEADWWPFVSEDELMILRPYLVRYQWRCVLNPF